jgi:hypothetical protein
MPLPDPRRWRTPPDDSRLVALAMASLGGEISARAALRLELDALLDNGADDGVQALLRDAPSAECYRHVQQMLARLVNKPERGDAVIARLFAIPLVIVAGAKKQLRLPDALPDIAAACALLEQHGVLGTGRSFGLGNALCSVETLDCLRPRLLRQWAAQLRTGGAPLELAGRAIEVAPGREQVYLRFLVGASVVPAHVPSAIETASDVGAWGMPFTRLLAQQLAQTGLEVLPIPRAPVTLYLASDAGRAAQIELAFSLFLSNEVRKFRMGVGDPAVVLSAHRTDDGGAELRVSLSSVFDESMLEGFRWPLYPPDDVEEISNKIIGVLDECRLNDVVSLSTVAADLNARGGRFLTARDAENTDAVVRAH